MADDSLNLPTPPAGAEPTASAAPAPAPAAPPEPSLDVRLAKALGPVAQAIQAVNQRLERVEQGVRPPEPPTKGEGGGDFWAEMAAAADPEAVLNKKFDERLNLLVQKLGPPIVRGHLNQRDAHLDRFAGVVDERFGDGFFDKELRPKLVTNDPQAPGQLELHTAAEQSDPKLILGAIRGMLGEQLWENEGATLERIANAKKAREARDPMNLVGSGINVARHPDRVSEDERAGLAALAAAGIDFTEKDFIESRKHGDSVDEWEHHFKPAAKTAARGA